MKKQIGNYYITINPFGVVVLFSIFWISILWLLPIDEIPLPILVCLWIVPPTFVYIVDYFSFGETQWLRDRRAESIVAAVKNGDQVPEFAIYLRSFAIRTTDEMERPKIATKWDKCIEEGIVRALGWQIPIITLRRSQERERSDSGRLHLINGIEVGYIGAGRVPVPNEHWEEVVQLLLDKSRYVFFIPFIGESLLWEASLICKKYLQKTIFIMPVSPYFCGIDYADEDWSKIVKYYERLGLVFPDYDEEGMLFYFDGTSNTAISEPMIEKTVRNSGEMEGITLREYTGNKYKKSIKKTVRHTIKCKCDYN